MAIIVALLLAAVVGIVLNFIAPRFAAGAAALVFVVVLLFSLV